MINFLVKFINNSWSKIQKKSRSWLLCSMHHRYLVYKISMSMHRPCLFIYEYLLQRKRMHARTAILQHSLLPSEGHKIQYPLHNVLNGNLCNCRLPNCKELITARKNYPTARNSQLKHEWRAPKPKVDDNEMLSQRW